jgi:adenylate cyclase
MADLIAQGEIPEQRWRKTLPERQRVVIGRNVDGWATPWDAKVSREHVAITWNGEQLMVEQLHSARNSVYMRGQPLRHFSLIPGQHFVIGQTSFSLIDDRVEVTRDVPEPMREQSFTIQDLQRIRFQHPDVRIHGLSSLPELISSASNDRELCQRLANVLLTGITGADAVAIVLLESATTDALDEPAAEMPERSDDGIDFSDQELIDLKFTTATRMQRQLSGKQSDPQSLTRVRVLHWDRRLMTAGEFRPSERLIRATLLRQETILHIWQSRENPGYTLSDNCDWAFCIPVPGEACRGWAIYLAGRLQNSDGISKIPADADDLKDDLKYSEIVASTLGSLRELRLLSRRQAGLAPFFSPRVRQVLSTSDPEKFLAPRETDVTVLFCDLRGFSRQSEEQSEALLALLERVSSALSVMSRRILEHGGVIGDFQGDAAMGFWGWPLPQHDSALLAARAALGIRAEFESFSKNEGHPLANFRVGIGLASGRAVAGKIGSDDQVQVTVFGPVVNRAQRLESMTRQIPSEILIDGATAALLKKNDLEQFAHVRPVALIQPFGMSQAVEVNLLFPALHESSHTNNQTNEIDHHSTFDRYERALQFFKGGDWRECRTLLDSIHEIDPLAQYLISIMAVHNDTPPEDWNGTIVMKTK